MAEQESLFMDKIRLSALVIDKEGQMIGSYASLQRRIKAGYIPLEEVKQYAEYHNCWRLIHELYSFMYHAKIKNSKKIKNEEKNKIKEIMGRYDDPNKKVLYNDIRTAYDVILNCIALSGYHEDKVKRPGSLEDEEN